MHMYIVILKLQPVKCVYKKSYCHQQHYILFLEATTIIFYVSTKNHDLWPLSSLSSLFY